MLEKELFFFIVRFYACNCAIAEISYIHHPNFSRLKTDRNKNALLNYIYEAVKFLVLTITELRRRRKKQTESSVKIRMHQQIYSM